ncbi:hypothetical protein TIFTF001_006479 [Ficus carica]|uniref:Uncharacterized protein n=1 Tax=Ficus carica TaxID=3494 RepID=A0AA88DFQ6_FICCA|nr:hypothetical protein TIFTF001_006479 [Ficus carica]
MKRLKLTKTYIDLNLLPIIDGWMSLAFDNGVKEMIFWVTTDVRGSNNGNNYPLPKRTFAVRSTNGSSKFYHLEMLWLEDVYENIVSFDLEELGEVAVPPRIKVDHLTITSLSPTASPDCAALNRRSVVELSSEDDNHSLRFQVLKKLHRGMIVIRNPF